MRNKKTRTSQEKRSFNMSRIRSKDTIIEILLRQELWKRGLRYRKNPSRIFGKPDIAFIKQKVLVFCDSEFWHGYYWESRKDTIKTNKDFWIRKIENNIKRDEEVNKRLLDDGWIVLRFSDKEIISNVVECADLVQQTISRKSP